MSFSYDVMPSPVMQSERIKIIDALRGFAILGILLMNMPAFCMPGGYDPFLRNEHGINYALWYIVSGYAEGTQRALFSMLFGAGIILFVSRQEKKLDGIRPAEYFFRRQLWLMVFGLIDVYLLLWFGDILFIYACYGMIMFAFQKLSPKALLIGAGICLLLMLARENRDLYQERKTIYRGEVAQAIDTTKVKLTEQQKDELGAMTGLKTSSEKDKRLKRVENAIRKTTGSYEQLYEYKTNQFSSGMSYIFLYIWDVVVFMFIGMAFYKMGILTGQAPAKVYWLMALIGLGVGLILSYFYLQPFINYKYNRFDYIKHQHFEFYSLAKTFRSLGIFAVIMLLFKSNRVKWLFALLQPVGQMAFTNYLTQSLICGILFYGVGFGLYGKLQRYEVYYIVGAIWLLQIVWSHIWLRYFYFGPLEWCWRSLTYWKKQPFLRKEL